MAKVFSPSAAGIAGTSLDRAAVAVRSALNGVTVRKPPFVRPSLLDTVVQNVLQSYRISSDCIQTNIAYASNAYRSRSCQGVIVYYDASMYDVSGHSKPATNGPN